MTVASSLQDFVIASLKEDLRIDGRRPFDSRRLNIKFSRQDGAVEVQLGKTHVMCVVTSRLTQPFPDRPNEGTLAIYTEFSPMADPVFEVGRPSETAVELGRVIDRGLRESRAVDMESLCVLAGKAVWALRVDICILDNGGNLIDAANTAALAALLSFRRPECSTEGGSLQDVVIHPPEVRESIPLIIHHLPISITFAFFGDGESVVMDPSDEEELVMTGRLTVTMNIHGDICAVQKGGGVGVRSSEIMRCFRIALTKVADITSSLKTAVEAHEIERAQRKIKRHKVVPVVQGMLFEISTGINEDTEMKDGRPKTEVMDEKELSSDDDSDSDTMPAIDENNVKQELLEPSQFGRHEESIFEGGVSKWDENMKSAQADTVPKSANSAEGFLDQVSHSIAEIGANLNRDGKHQSLLDAVKSKKKKKKGKKQPSLSEKQ